MRWDDNERCFRNLLTHDLAGASYQTREELLETDHSCVEIEVVSEYQPSHGDARLRLGEEFRPTLHRGTKGARDGRHFLLRPLANSLVRQDAALMSDLAKTQLSGPVQAKSLVNHPLRVGHAWPSRDTRCRRAGMRRLRPTTRRMRLSRWRLYREHTVDELHLSVSVAQSDTDAYKVDSSGTKVEGVAEPNLACTLVDEIV